MIYYIDGNNVQGESMRWERATVDGGDALIQDVSLWADQRGKRVVIFFDGHAVDSRAGTIQIKYPQSSRGEATADDTIVNAIASSGEAGNIIVVTDDRELQQRARAAGAGDVKSANDFRSEMKLFTREGATEIDDGEHPEPPTDPAATAEMMEFLGIDPTTAERPFIPPLQKKPVEIKEVPPVEPSKESLRTKRKQQATSEDAATATSEMNNEEWLEYFQISEADNPLPSTGRKEKEKEKEKPKQRPDETLPAEQDNTGNENNLEEIMRMAGVVPLKNKKRGK